MPKIRALIVDDEPPARRKLRGFLEGEDQVEIVGEAGDGHSAIEAIRQLRPDLVFLDIQMPHFTGFEVLAALPEGSLPCIVFVTAYDEYALKAFEVHALDYLLKPFDLARFQKAMRQVRERLGDGTKELQRELSRLLAELRSQRQYLSRLMVRGRGRVVFLRVEEIDWIEASANYVELHVGTKTYLHRETVGGMTEKLDPDRFVRIHRSRIVNLDRIREVHPWSRNDYLLVLHDGTRIQMSRRYKANLDMLMRP